LTDQKRKMVFAEELNQGDCVLLDDQEFIVMDIVTLDEAGPEGQKKLEFTLEGRDDSTVNRKHIALASEEIELAEAAGDVYGHRRLGVSSATGIGDSASAWEKVVIAKTGDERKAILDRVADNVFFELLDDVAREELADVVFPKQFASGEILMREGEEGDLFYILEQGEAHIFVLGDKGQEVVVRQCKQGDSFGELALMYNAPRNATVRALTDLKCWCMDRENFQYVIVRASMKKSDRYFGFLESVPLFASMDKADKMKLVEALIPRKVKKDSVVVRQGDIGDMFYLVERGGLDVIQLTPAGHEEVVNKKGPGDYFGEISLMADMPRSATVTTTEDCVLLTLDRKSFVSLIGSMEPELRRNVSMYKTYVDYAEI